jgi:hypothetical protein
MKEMRQVGIVLAANDSSSAVLILEAGFIW